MSSINTEHTFKIIVRIDGVQQEYLLTQERITIGRSKSVEVTIANENISRRHLEISKNDKNIFIKDLGTANGTRLNGHKLVANEKKIYESGDEIEIGDCEIYLAIYPGGHTGRIKSIGERAYAEKQDQSASVFKLKDGPIQPRSEKESDSSQSSSEYLETKKKEVELWACEIRLEIEKKRKKLLEEKTQNVIEVEKLKNQLTQIKLEITALEKEKLKIELDVKDHREKFSDLPATKIEIETMKSSDKTRGVKNIDSSSPVVLTQMSINKNQIENDSQEEESGNKDSTQFKNISQILKQHKKSS